MSYAASRAYKALAESNYSKSQLKQRGWTEKLIREFLGEPDESSENPHYSCAAPVCFFSMKRVHRSEKSKRFLRAKQVADQRKAAAKKAAETKLQKTADLVKALIDQIDVTYLDMPTLLRSAIESYNAHQKQLGKDNYASTCSAWQDNDEFLARICVNYLRHHCTPYHQHLDSLSGKVGTRDAYRTIKEEVLEAIAWAYPALADECTRQQHRMYWGLIE